MGNTAQALHANQPAGSEQSGSGIAVDPVPAPTLSAQESSVAQHRAERRENLVLLFGVLNLLCFQAILYIPLVASVASELRLYFLPIELALSGLVYWFGLATLRRDAIIQIRCQRFGGNEILFCGITFLLLSALVAPIESYRSAAVGAWYNSFLLLAPLAQLALIVPRKLLASLDRENDVRLAAEVSRARLIPLAADGKPQKNEQLFIEVANVRPGDIVRVVAGETVPCDGTIILGHSELLERSLAGHLSPTFRGIGEEVVAGSRIVRGQVDLRVDAKFEDSSVTRGEELFLGVASEWKAAESRVAQVEWGFVVSLFIFSLFVGQLWYLSGSSLSEAITAIGSVLVLVQFPFALQLGSRFVNRALACSYKLGALLRDPKLFLKLRSVQTVGIEYAPAEMSGVDRVIEFKLLDDRIDRNSLLQALLVLMSRGPDERYRDLVAYCRTNSKGDSELVQVRDFGFFPGLGFTGSIQGGEFTVGGEEIMIERGVQLHASELEQVSEDRQPLYVAIGDEVVATFTVEPGGNTVGSAMVRRLRALGLRTLLFGEQSQKALDSAGRRWGLDLAHIYGELTPAKYREKIESLKPIALLVHRETPTDRINLADITFSLFDHLLSDLKRSTVTLIHHDVEIIPKLFILARRSEIVRTLVLALSVVFSGAVMASALFNPVPPVLIMSSGVVLMALFGWFGRFIKS